MKKCGSWSWLIIALVIVSQIVYAQKSTVSGKIKDKTDHSAMVGVGVLLVSAEDSTKSFGNTTDVEGVFQIQNVPFGSYKIKTVYLGYNPIVQNVDVRESQIQLAEFQLEQVAVLVKEVLIEGRQLRAIQKGDTTEYNAGAFKTNPDATAQDLVAKMPGVTIENGTVKAQGEAVKKVLIDGKEYFGDDASIALKNLPAEIIDRVQIFDRMSDQARFSGFDDGNSQKAINILTKKGMNNGTFGKVFGGYGTDDRYTSGINLNNFKGDRKISLIGISNNINQQNFATQDLLGVMGTGGNSSRGRGANGPTGGGPSGQNNPANNFLVGQQSGITRTTSLGLNYSDAFGKKWLVTGSYFFNNAKNNTESLTARNYFLSNGNTQQYEESSTGGKNNFNHRLNARIEYNIDSNNSVIITPKISLQNNSGNSNLSGVNTLTDNALLSQLLNSASSQTNGYELSNEVLFRHKFAKERRTISANVTTSYNDKVGESNQYSQNRFYLPKDSVSLVDQRSNTNTNGYTVSSNLMYTEPIGKFGGIMMNYSPSYSQNNSNKETNGIDSLTKEYKILNPVLSNQFDNFIFSQRAGVGYRFGSKNLKFMVNANYQNVQMDSRQIFPASFSFQKSFNNVLPMAMLNYKFNNNKNLRFYYRSATNAPSITQLQNVINNSNPLQLSVGNPDLKQEYVNQLIARFGSTNTEKARVFQAFATASYTNNYIGSSTIIADRNIQLNENVVLNRGSQLTQSVNMNGYLTTNEFVTYGFPVGIFKSNMNLNVAHTYNRTPSLINNETNISKSNTYTSGFTLGSNISKLIDFTLSYSANYNVVKNTIQPSQNNTYFYHVTSAKLNWSTNGGILLGAEATNTLYRGLGSAFNQNYYLVNPFVGYKFLKDKVAELKLTVFDLLDQNNSVSRSVYAGYIEDKRSLVLKRYYMVTLTYNFRKFKSSEEKAPN